MEDIFPQQLIFQLEKKNKNKNIQGTNWLISSN